MAALHEEDSNFEFEVENIIAHRVEKGRRGLSYFVTWKGYGPDFNSWEPEQGMKGCKKSIQKYWDSLDRDHVAEPGPSTSTGTKPKNQKSSVSDMPKTCLICKMTIDDLYTMGPLLQDKTGLYATHLNCMKFSPVLERRSRTSAGIHGFSLRDIQHEAKRAALLVSSP